MTMRNMWANVPDTMHEFVSHVLLLAGTAYAILYWIWHRYSWRNGLRIHCYLLFFSGAAFSVSTTLLVSLICRLHSTQDLRCKISSITLRYLATINTDIYFSTHGVNITYYFIPFKFLNGLSFCPPGFFTIKSNPNLRICHSKCLLQPLAKTVFFSNSFLLVQLSSRTPYLMK